MATLENRTGYYNIVFRYGGKRYTRSLHTDDAQQAERLLANLEQTLRDVRSGRLVLPDTADIPSFLLSDGKLAQSPDAQAETIAAQRLTLRDLFAQFFEALPEGALEPTTVSLLNIHRGHLLRLLGDDVPLDQIDLSALDGYSRKRSREPGRGDRKVGATTIRKELATLRQVWNWGRKRGKLSGELPATRDVQLPRSEERPPFQTYAEIEAQIAQDDLSRSAQKRLWETLYLSAAEVRQLLEHVQQQPQQPFLYPMVVTAAHTGARRMELVRSQLADIRDDALIIREKKRRRGRETTRRVPLSALLRQTLNDWKASHPGGKHTFVIQESGNGAAQPITPDQAQSQLRQALAGSPWSVIPGWHCLRHSFISNLASQAVDQRLIDEFVGHCTDDMRRRYRHLFPDVKQAAIEGVFG